MSSPFPRDQITLENLISSWDKMPDDGKKVSKASKEQRNPRICRKPILGMSLIGLDFFWGIRRDESSLRGALKAGFLLGEHPLIFISAQLEFPWIIRGLTALSEAVSDQP